MPRIDFGVQIEPQYGFTYERIRTIADTCESLGFESIWVSDHFFMTDDSYGINCLECWTILTALARDTRTLRIGPMVAAQSYRTPALLAKIAATIDHISKGRLDFGIGAGWKQVEYRAYGYPFPPFMTRIEQLDEFIQITKKMWTEERASFRGRHYHVEDALCYPKPVQKPHPPVWVGGYGDRTLKLVAKHADACNFAWTLPVKRFEHRLAALRKHCQETRRDYHSIRKSCGLMITMAPTAQEVKQKLDRQSELKDTPYMRYLSRQLPNLVGTPDAIAARIREYVALGIDHFILRFHYGDEIASMILFSDEVKNKL